MRFLIPAVLVMAVTGCTGSSSTIDVLDLKPSSEVTSSIAPRPAAEIGDAVAAMIGDTPETSHQPDPFASELVIEQEVALVAPSRPLKREHSGKQKIYHPRFRDAKPVKFKGAAPHPFQVHGVDVSKYQGKIDWDTLRRQGASFAFIKATEGDDHSDEAFTRNWRAAAEAGIPRGAYHFYYWCSTAKDQAAWFIRNVPKEKGALPPVIDVEWNAHSRNCRKRPGRDHVLSEMKIFMDALERHYGQRPIIYTAPDFYKDNLLGRFGDYSFWLRSVVAHPNQIYPDRDWAFWQYSGTGLSQGVGNHIDLNVFNGTERGWHDWVNRRTR